MVWTTSEAFDDGPALFDAVCRLDLDGVVAKQLESRYKANERGWIKTKNRNYWIASPASRPGRLDKWRGASGVRAWRQLRSFCRCAWPVSAGRSRGRGGQRLVAPDQLTAVPVRDEGATCFAPLMRR